MFLNNRHYDPSTGVFVSVDPLVTKTMQPYIYGAANPIRFSDPQGLEPRPIHCRTGCGDPRKPVSDLHGRNSDGYGGGPREIQNRPGSWRSPAPAYFPGRCCDVPDQPMLRPGPRQVYEVGWPLFSNENGGAASWMAKLQSNPNGYFPFTVECIRGNCNMPIAVGNVLDLYGQFDIGAVEVISADGTSFTFLALDDHSLAAGGTVTFTLFDQLYSDGYVEVNLSVSATAATSGLESRIPTAGVEVAGKFTWSMMAAAFRCENAYVGQEQFRRC